MVSRAQAVMPSPRSVRAARASASDGDTAGAAEGAAGLEVADAIGVGDAIGVDDAIDADDEDAGPAMTAPVTSGAEVGTSCGTPPDADALGRDDPNKVPRSDRIPRAIANTTQNDTAATSGSNHRGVPGARRMLGTAGRGAALPSLEANV